MKSGFSYRGFLSAGAAFGALIVGFGAQAADGADAVVDEVVVSATRAATPVEQLGDAISVLDAEQIELQQLMTLDDALERVPGVAITRSGGVGQNTQIRMRGFTTKHVLVMLDGVKVNNPSEADNQFGIDHLFLDNV
ncbi:MAG: TonB-dependent receptor, partial [Amphiplicatus sp.]|nr:TonB-dependent receptor [Amphiplicatus sp.]